MSKLDLLLIHPNGRAGAYQGLSAFAAKEPPLWAAMLAAYVRKQGPTVAILDAEMDELDPGEIAAVVEAKDPTLVAIVVYGHHPSASTQVMPAALAAAREIVSRFDRKVILVGGHVAALPVRTVIEDPKLFACSGEGFVTLVELVRALSGKTRLEDVPDLVWSENDALKKGPSAKLVANLDSIGMPAWDLLGSLDRYRAHNWHALGQASASPYASLYTSLGCKFDCEFCCIQAPFRSGETASAASSNSYRRWSAKAVGYALEHLASQGVVNVKIADEMFVLNPGHVEAVCDEILKRKLKLNLWAYARTDTVRDGMVDKLKAAGFNWLAFGIESGDPLVRAGSNKRLGFSSDIAETLEKVRKAGIHVIANYIFGLPGESLDTMEATLALATHLNTEFANFYAAMAYPGSALYSQASRARPVDLPRSWSGYSQHSIDSKPLRTMKLSAEEILAFRDKAFVTYHSSAGYLSMLEKTFGKKAVEEIRSVLAVKLERKTPT